MAQARAVLLEPVRDVFRLVRCDEEDSEAGKACLLETLVFGWNLFGRVDGKLLTDARLSRRMALTYFDKAAKRVYVRSLQKKKAIFIESPGEQPRSRRQCPFFQLVGDTPPDDVAKFCDPSAELHVGERIIFQPSSPTDKTRASDRFVYELQLATSTVPGTAGVALERQHAEPAEKKALDLLPVVQQINLPRKRKSPLRAPVSFEECEVIEIDMSDSSPRVEMEGVVKKNRRRDDTPTNLATVQASKSSPSSNKKGSPQQNVQAELLSNTGAVGRRGFFSEADVIMILPHPQDCSVELAKAQRSKVCENGGQVVPDNKLSRKPAKNKIFFENHVSHIVASEYLTAGELVKQLNLGDSGLAGIRCRFGDHGGGSDVKSEQSQNLQSGRPFVWIVNFSWIRTCLRRQEKVAEIDYLWRPFVPRPSSSAQALSAPAPSRRKLRLAEELEQSPSPPHFEHDPVKLVHDNGVRSSKSGVDLANPCHPGLDRLQTLAAAAERKSFVVKVLRDMGDAYEMRSVRAGANKQDKWRKKTYDNCADAVEWHCGEDFMEAVAAGRQSEVLRLAASIDGIGEKMATKVAAIAITGYHKRMDILDDIAIQGQLALKKIHGVGLATARDLYNAGFTSIAKLRAEVKRRAENGEPPLLNRSQTIGLDSYEDLCKKIPRRVVKRLSERIERAAQLLLPGVQVTTCGSYRRGCAESGDIDILITNPNGDCPILHRLVEQLHADGVLVADLSRPSDHVAGTKSTIGNIDGQSDTYMGVGVYEDDLNPGNFVRCRIDIKVYPHHQIAYALIYFTGSTMFLRKLKLLALRQNLMLGHVHMTHTATHRDRVCNNQEFGPSRVIPAMYTEEEVFNFLGLEYVPPTQRFFFSLSTLTRQVSETTLQTLRGKRQ